MRSYKEKKILKKQLDKVFCNLCGKELQKDAFGQFEDHIHIEKTWGYSSKKDGCKTELDLCEDCFDDLVEKFKIPLDESY